MKWFEPENFDTYVRELLKNKKSSAGDIVRVIFVACGYILIFGIYRSVSSAIGSEPLWLFLIFGTFAFLILFLLPKSEFASRNLGHTYEISINEEFVGREDLSIDFMLTKTIAKVKFKDVVNYEILSVDIEDQKLSILRLRKYDNKTKSFGISPKINQVVLKEKLDKYVKA